MTELAALWHDASLQLARLCAANGVQYFHFLQPNQYLPGSKQLSEEELRTAFLGGHAYGRWVPLGYPLLREEGSALVAAGVKFHDLTDVFADVTETIYVDDCCHVNERGNELMAREMARFVLSQAE